jgi:hypothetical protein
VSAQASSMSFPRPDWVMCGMPNFGGGVRLIASKELNRAELEAQFERPEIWDDVAYALPPVVRQRYILTAEMRTFTVVDAPDYPAAFKSLFEGWSPEPAARTALGEGQRAITLDGGLS